LEYNVVDIVEEVDLLRTILRRATLYQEDGVISGVSYCSALLDNQIVRLPASQHRSLGHTSLMESRSAAFFAKEIEATDSYRSAFLALREKDSARPFDVVVVSQIKLVL
jgi:hypothetical protein